jgi:dTDP-4-amino-4,6-dideoxygalactose transaminase
MFSFHATKLYHSLEGGMLMFSDPGLKKTFDYLKNFGFENEVEVVMPGTNAKMNEVQALMGLQVLGHLPAIVNRRQRIDALYRSRLKGVPGLHIPEPPADNVRFNYAYFPMEVDGADFGINRDELYAALQKYNIFTRRYFYPLVSDFPCYRNLAHSDPLTTAGAVATRILTLPIYDSLALDDVERICDIVGHIYRMRGKGARGQPPAVEFV